MLGDSDAKNVLQKSGSVTSKIHLNKKLIMIINDDVKSSVGFIPTHFGALYLT